MSEPMSVDLASELEALKLAVELSGVEVSELVLPTDHHVISHRVRLHYLDWGTRGEQPILFLHGGGLTAHTWDVVCLTLRASYHCLALDQRGHGDSEWSPEMDYGSEAHLRDIEGFVELLGLKRFILVGQSMGALNAFTYAARHGDRLSGLVLVDAGPELRADGAQRIGDFMSLTAELDSVDEFVERAVAFNPLRDRRLLRRSLLHNLRRLPNGKWARKNDMRQRAGTDFREITARLQASWKDPHRVVCPSLVVRGAQSDVFLDEHAERFAHSLPNGRWVRIEGAGHTVQGDNPRGLVAAMRQFLGEIGA